jgi:hypothetical protein
MFIVFQISKYYMDRTMGVSSKKQILVIRTEFLKQDYMELNDWLATGGHRRSTIKQTIPRMVWMEPNPEHNVEQHPVKDGVIDKDITPLGLFHLCCALLDELDIYSFLIRGAGNLSPEAKKQSLQTLTTQCGEEETRRRDCANSSTP